MKKKPLKFYHLLYLHPCLFQLSLTAGDHSGPGVHSRASVPRQAPPAGAAPHRRAAPFPSLSRGRRPTRGGRCAPETAAACAPPPVVAGGALLLPPRSGGHGGAHPRRPDLPRQLLRPGPSSAAPSILTRLGARREAGAADGHRHGQSPAMAAAPSATTGMRRAGPRHGDGPSAARAGPRSGRGGRKRTRRRLRGRARRAAWAERAGGRGWRTGSPPRRRPCSGSSSPRRGRRPLAPHASASPCLLRQRLPPLRRRAGPRACFPAPCTPASAPPWWILRRRPRQEPAPVVEPRAGRRPASRLPRPGASSFLRRARRPRWSRGSGEPGAACRGGCEL